MDLSKSLTYAFDDPEWKTKLGLTALISLVPILNFAYHGYAVDLLRNAEAGRPLPLPGWEDLEKKFITGLKVGAALFIYGLPLFGLMLIGVGATFLPALSNNDDVQGALATVTLAAWGGLVCLVLLYALVFGFYVPAMLLNFARHDTFASCFQIGAIIALIRDNLSQYLMAWGMTLAVGFGYSFLFSAVTSVVSFIPCLGFLALIVIIPLSLVGAAWLATVHGYLFGQVGQRLEGGPGSAGYISAA